MNDTLKPQTESEKIETGAEHPASSKALKRERQQRKILESSLNKKNSEIEKLRKKIERLEKENEKLKQELKSARGVPGWVKPNLNPEDKPKRKKRGKKEGQKPNIRTIPAGEPDEEVTLELENCPFCLMALGDAKRFHCHTQVDLPLPSRPIVTKFHVGSTYCPGCKKEVSAGGRLTGTKYGPRLHAQVAALKFDSGMTLGKISRLLANQYSLEISTGQLSEILSRVGELFCPAHQELKTQLRSEKHLHADETGWRVEGNNQWLWSFSNENISVYVIEPTRGQIVVENTLGQTWDGVLTTDFYGAYNAIDCPKQKCWTHLLRELRELKQTFPDNLEIKAYSKQVKTFFYRAKDVAKDLADGQEVEKRLSRLHGDLLRFSEVQRTHDDLIRLSKRLFKHRSEMLTFIKSGTDPTNNNAEREIRPAVLMRKTSYGNRSEQGKETQAALMSMVRTCAKRGENFTQFASSYLGAQ
jgi:transposase